MSTSIEKLREIVQLLDSQLAEGWTSLAITNTLFARYQRSGFGVAEVFFRATYAACYQNSVLMLSKLLDTHKDSVNIPYLLNLAERSSEEFPFATKQDVKRAVQQHRQYIQEVQSFLGGVRERRDRLIAHLDKNLVNDGGNAFLQPPLDSVETEECYKRLHEMLNYYEHSLSNTEWYVEGAVRKVVRDLDYLFTFLDDV